MTNISRNVNTSSNTNFWGDINTTGNTTGDTTPAASPDAADDPLTFNGGIGINITGTAAADTLSWAFSRDGMADTAVVGTDTFSFFDGSNSNEPEFRSFNDLFEDLNVPFGVPGTGIVVKTSDGPDAYTTRDIVASAAEDFVGLNVVNGDGVAGNPTVGLDIDGLTDPNDDMTATDEFPLHDKSEGTGGANRKMTGQNIADGVANILNISTLGFSTIPAETSPADDQTLLTFTDSTRTGSPTLSVESLNFTFSDNSVGNNNWIEIGNAIDTDSGHIMPLNGMVVGATVHCEDVGAGNTYTLELFRDATDVGDLFTGLTGTNYTDTDPTLEFTFTAGQKLRIRSSRTAGTGVMQDIVVNLQVRWQA